MLAVSRKVQQMVRNWTEYSAFRSELECAGEADAADCDGCAEERGCAWWESADLCNGGGRSGAYHASDDFGVCLLYGFNPAVYSGVMLVRMYMLLALWILLVTWLHVKSLQERKRGFSFYLPLMAVVYLGFLTHYYFAVYLFSWQRRWSCICC